MDRRLALRELPTGYALALTLRDEGHDDLAIADRLGLDPTAIGTLLTLADAKLARALAAEQPLGRRRSRPALAGRPPAMNDQRRDQP